MKTKAIIRNSYRQLIYTGIIALVIFIVPLILDFFGIETINLLILPYLIYRFTSTCVLNALIAQLLLFFLGLGFFYLIALIIKSQREIH